MWCLWGKEDFGIWDNDKRYKKNMGKDIVVEFC